MTDHADALLQRAFHGLSPGHEATSRAVSWPYDAGAVLLGTFDLALIRYSGCC
jgi:hypothetical protein